MKNLITAIVCVGLASAVIVTPSVSAAQVSKQGSKYLFRIKWSPGKSYSYKMTTSVTGGQSMNLAGALKLKVLSVASGVANIESTMSGMGSQQPMTQKIKMDSRGKVVGQTSAQSMGTNMEFPKDPVAVGGTWNSTISMGGTGNLNSKNTLKGFKTINGKQYAHVVTSVTTSGSTGGMKMTGSGDSLVDMADGMSLRATFKMDMTVPMTRSDGGAASSQAIKMAVSVNRQ